MSYIPFPSLPFPSLPSINPKNTGYELLTISISWQPRPPLMFFLCFIKKEKKEKKRGRFNDLE